MPVKTQSLKRQGSLSEIRRIGKTDFDYKDLLATENIILFTINVTDNVVGWS